ncbi:hypothetical protein ACJJTC_000397 [Scirpophaga incertulas]
MSKTATFLVVVALSSSSVLQTPAAKDTFELLILHNNDMHARFEQTSQLSGTCTTVDRDAGKCYGGFPRVATVVKEARKAAASGEGPPVLYLNAGDTYTGTAWFSIYKWKIAAEFLNALQPDAVSLGNHEFDNNVQGLTPFIENLTSPVLAANLILTKVPELEKQTNLKKSIIIEVAGRKVGVVGYLTPETKFLAKSNEVEYIDEIDALKIEVLNLQNKGVKIIIALGHSGYLKDLEIAKKVEGLDLVIGGHSNTFLWNGTTIPDIDDSQGPYPTYVKQASGRSVLVVQAYAYTKYLGKLHLVFNLEGDIISADGQPILLNQRIPQDPELLAIVDDYKSKLKNVTEGMVGETKNILDGLSCQYKECNLGNLIADAIFYTYTENYIGKYWTDVNVAFIQGGGIRASIDSADNVISKGDLLTVLPFGGNIAKLTINGSIMLQILEHSVSKYSLLDTPGEFLQFSGLKVVYDTRKPVGKRVVSVKVRCSSCKVPEYFALEKKKEYKILIPVFLALGGDGYFMLIDIPHEKQGYDELYCTQNYISKRSPVYPEVEGRSCLGNHEFDEGITGLTPFIRNLTAPILAANLILDDVPEMAKQPNLQKSITIQIGYTKIGIIGYLTPDTQVLAPKNKVKYIDEIIAITREVEILKKQNVTILIALGHSGYIRDLEIAKNVNDLDLVIGGHSNTFLWNNDTIKETPEYPQGLYPTIVTQPSGRKVLVVQAYAYTKYMGKLLLRFNSKGDVVKHNGLPLLLHQEIPEDEDLLTKVNKYSKEISEISNEIVGESLVFLNGKCRLSECNLGNLISDSVINYTKSYKREYSDVNIAVIQGGRIRTSITHINKPFKISRGDLMAVLPFSDSLTIVTMNGTLLIQALEHSVSTWRTIDSTGQFLQVAGIQVTYDLSRPPGSRVIDSKAACTSCGKNLLEIKAYLDYKIIMPSFLADGGDGYEIFVDRTKDIVTYNELDCVLNYIQHYSPVQPEADNATPSPSPERQYEYVYGVYHRKHTAAWGSKLMISPEVGKSDLRPFAEFPKK